MGPFVSESMTSLVRFSLTEYDAMLAQGIFDERRHQRIELIYGELRQMSPPGPLHDELVNRIADWCYDNADRSQVRVRVQSALGIPELDSVPMPDAALVRRHDYSTRRPQPADALLVIEVSDSSLADDRREKADLYAAAGIHDYWIINVLDWTVEVFRDPSPAGYRLRRSYAGGEKVSPLAVPGVALDVGELFRR